MIAKMARLARVVVEGLAHHVTQRGNRRQPVFFSDSDYRACRSLLAEGCRAAGVEVWAYCLMPNHVHLILVPSTADGLRAALGEAHRRYTRAVNLREGWRGYLWQGRFASVAMDEPHLLAAARYVELNPVRGSLVDRPDRWPWSSARAHLAGRDDELVATSPLLGRIPNWSEFLAEGLSEAEHRALQLGERTGRPLGSEAFVTGIERRLERPLSRQKRGPKPKEQFRIISGTQYLIDGNGNVQPADT
ncbi:MAG: transposase [Caulobacterales bacterium]